MNYSHDEKDDKKKLADDKEKEEVKKQQKSDPQITELKGLTDPDEALEVKGTDNPS